MEKEMLGGKLKFLRERVGWSQNQIAEYLGISVEQLQKVEQGQATLTATMMDQLMNLFGCSLEFLEYGDLDSAEQLCCAFRAEGLATTDLQFIAKVNHVVLNAAMMANLMVKNNDRF